jgi:hypothetical protein
VRLYRLVTDGRLIMYPHRDSRVLHAPGECEYCDLHPELQEARLRGRIAFSGHPAPDNGFPCPADAAVEAGERGDYNRWPGNTPEGYTWTWPVEAITVTEEDVIEIRRRLQEYMENPYETE